MKYLVLFTVILALSISSCSPVTQPPEPISTSTYTPTPTATATPTPTITPSPTPDPMQLVADQLGKEGINVDTTTGALRYYSAEVPNAKLDSTGLHIQVNDKEIDISTENIPKQVSIKEGSMVIYNKDQALYNNPDMSQWPEVVAAWYPTARTKTWQGWKERADVISVDVENPIQVGNTWNEYFDFVANEKAFLQPFPPGTYRLTPNNKIYDGPNGTPLPPFEAFDAWSKPDFINPIRPSQNLWVVSANKDEGRSWDTSGITEQVSPQIFDATNVAYVKANEQVTQAFHFTITDNNRVLTQARYFEQALASGNDAINLPMININANYGGGTLMVNLNAYAHKFGYLDEKGNSTGQIEADVAEFMNTGKIPVRLQRAWNAGIGVWYHSLGF